MATCNSCGYAIRGKNHANGEHHKRQRPEHTKQEILLGKRIHAFEADKFRLEKTTSGGFRNQIHRPGSLQVGRCRS